MCVSKITSVLSINFHTIYGAVCIQLTHFSHDDCENTCTWSYYQNQVRSMTHLPSFRVRSWNNDMRCIPIYIVINLWYGQIDSWDNRVLMDFAPNLVLCHWHHYADLPTCIEHIRWKILERFVKACWVYSVESFLRCSSLGYFPYFLVCCMCLTGPSKFRWSRRYIHKSSYYHHQTGSISLSHCCHVSPGCVSEMAVTSYAIGFWYIFRESWVWRL